MQNIKIEFSYNGQNYFGLQKQKNKVTVQGEIERALKELFNDDINLIIAGRTDRGVSANKMVANFFVDTKIDAKKICYALNYKLPEDIRILNSEKVDDSFHARHSAKLKTYKYSLYENNFSLPLFNYEAQIKTKLDYLKMKKAIKYFIGTHDFSSFVTNIKEVENPIRTIFKTKLKRITYLGVNHYYFYFKGSGFLYNQIRIMVGTLIMVGLNKIKPKDIKNIMQAKNRSLAGSVMPAKGLMLEDIKYK